MKNFYFKQVRSQFTIVSIWRFSNERYKKRASEQVGEKDKEKIKEKQTFNTNNKKR